MKRHIILAATIALGAMVGCKTKQATGTANTNSGPPTVVYKTKADYSQYVPVTLSADKSQIVAYPAITDIYYKGKLAIPVQLNKGYWLDNRGIGPNSAFLELTYEEYKNLKEVPRLDDLYKRIKDNDPFTEIYNLGDRNRFKNEVEEINQIISKGGLKKFTRLK
jgi:hypothetical protein